MNHDPASALRAQRWRDLPPEFLGRTLGAALEARKIAAKRRSLIAFIPRPLRFPLAACWLLAFFFRVTTPAAIPQATLDSYAKLPPLTPAQLLANLKHIEQLADELLHPRHQGPQPPL